MAKKADRQISAYDQELAARLLPLVDGRTTAVAREAEVLQQSLWNWAHARAKITAGDLRKVARALGVDALWLLTGEDLHMPGPDLNMSWLETAIDFVESAVGSRKVTPVTKAGLIRRAYEILLEEHGVLSEDNRKKLLQLVKKR